MADNVHRITERATELILPILDEMGYELVDVEYLSKYGKWVLRLYIDKHGGVTIADCARVSREVGDLIDVKDVIDHDYVLEVSSPGLNRPLKSERDLLRVVGEKVKIKMAFEVKGQRNFTGYLKDFSDGKLLLEVEGRMISIPWAEVKKANLVYEFARQ
jgi:ribosome maturation factor RimP